ncbi:type IX secretion system outer membrane channel protein PorV [Dyadobacter aurulentus]|uniref:type IX secretion system outer membrane channel protein PorV n=1 Tax=Dyadobacter sp. UC 10 TaxID=2605428 RepID=UPI0011F3FFD0|nr:type IX secretion system outer membrane channel protein PorV [Dyadobacter sp. UC 10]KAA0991916.1 type IX secretion system outer membrane channel protein PorV [Dyadobacter sp. UC 10]
MNRKILSLSFFLLTLAQAGAQPVDSVRIPIGLPYMLEINPDARTAAMGYAGAALSPDANATYINSSKLAAAREDFGASVSYTPWLPNLVDGMWLGYASAYKKLGERQAVAASVQYFDYDVYTTGGAGNRAHDIAISGMYSRQLDRNFSMGLTLKYISSDWGQGVVAGNSVKPGRAIAADISAYYRKRLKDESTGQDFSWSFGAVLANIGNKIDYGVGGGQYFLPAKLRVGGGISYSATGRHRINLIADASKLLVPTPVGGSIVSSPKSFEAIFKSFTDAPGGFKEEMQEIMIGVGAEYWYNDVVALRAGYYNENERKTNQKLVTVGAGARIFKKYQADFGYAFSAQKGSAVLDTYRATLSFYLNGKKG